MRVLFLGTGLFGRPAFEAVADSPHELVGLVTQPDRGGRGKHTHPSPMKLVAQEYCAEARGVPVFQPANVNAAESLDRLRAFDAEVFVVAAYGQILSEKFLAVPPRGAFNLHASVLPAYRGAAPIHAAVRDGVAETGVTLFRIVRELDAGPVVGITRTPVGDRETTGELHDRLADLAAPLTLRFLDELAAGTAVEVPQDHAAATFAPKLPKEAGRIDWTAPADAVARHVRAMTPWPRATTRFLPDDGPPVPVVVTAVSPVPAASSGGGEPGELLGDGAAVACGRGAVLLEELTPAGKRPMTGDAFLRGRGAGRFAA